MAERTGCQEPTLHVCAPYEVSMGRFCAEWERAYKGVTLNPWQLPILDDWLALGPGLRYVHPRNLLEVPRQNGKTELALARIDFGIAILPLLRAKAGLSPRGERILYSAHQYSTAVEIFGRMQEYWGTKANDPNCRYPQLNRMVKYVRKAISKESIALKDEYGGGVVYFATRTNAASIGFTVDAILGDEAQDLTETQQTAFVSTSSSAPLHNSQFIYLGTPPTPISKGDVFQDMREKVVSGEDDGSRGAISLSEWSVNDVVSDGFGDVTDQELWWRLNPAMGLNMQPDAPNKELGMYRQPLSFAQQRLGYWLPKAKAESRFFDRADWDACEVADEQAPEVGRGRLSCGVKFSPDGSTIAWSWAYVPDDGTAPYVELWESMPVYGGLDQCIAWVARRRRQLALVVIDGQAGATDLEERLRKEGLPRRRVRVATSGDYVGACSMALSAVAQHDLRHIRSDALDESVRAARRRKVGRSGVGMDDGEEVPCTPAESMALALYGARTARNIDTEGRAG